MRRLGPAPDVATPLVDLHVDIGFYRRRTRCHVLWRVDMGLFWWLIARFGALIASLGRHQRWEAGLEKLAELLTRRLETNVILWGRNRLDMGR